MPSGYQTEVRGLPLLHHAREPLQEHHEVIFVEAASMCAIAQDTSSPEIRRCFSRHVSDFIRLLRPAILTGSYVMSGFSVKQDVLRAQQDIFWANNINHAASHLRGKLV